MHQERAWRSRRWIITVKNYLVEVLNCSGQSALYLGQDMWSWSHNRYRNHSEHFLGAIHSTLF